MSCGNVTVSLVGPSVAVSPDKHLDSHQYQSGQILTIKDLNQPTPMSSRTKGSFSLQSLYLTVS